MGRKRTFPAALAKLLPAVVSWSMVVGLSRIWLVLALLLTPTVAAPQTVRSDQEQRVRALVRSAPFKAASAALGRSHDEWVENVIRLTEIPAPPFKEQARAKAFAAMLRSRGLADVEIDAEGNVLGRRKGTSGGPLVVVSAHLDTVFPEGTNVTVRRQGDKLFAPGVGDDSAGLATLLSLLDAMNAARIRTERDLLFVGTVGEEGLGNLRGVRHLFTEGRYKGRIGAFFSIDGDGDEINTRGTGSKRYRVTYKGPGGHSYNAFGTVNPLAALSYTVTELYKLNVPLEPKTTYSASVVGGGTSVNAIPDEVWLEVDMRSEDAAGLGTLEKQFLTIVRRSAEAENAARSTARGRITAEAKLIGDRPAGRTSPSAAIVGYTHAAFRAEGMEARDRAGSTDGNVPMSLGIPSVTVPGNASGGASHALDEWIGVERAGNVRLKRVLLATFLAAAGLAR
jgi:acetylornithine deacetylase/succinyl-diaminopimelate desuccinylase-like protein